MDEETFTNILVGVFGLFLIIFNKYLAKANQWWMNLFFKYSTEYLSVDRFICCCGGAFFVGLSIYELFIA